MQGHIKKIRQLFQSKGGAVRRGRLEGSRSKPPALHVCCAALCALRCAALRAPAADVHLHPYVAGVPRLHLINSVVQDLVHLRIGTESQ